MDFVPYGYQYGSAWMDHRDACTIVSFGKSHLKVIHFRIWCHTASFKKWRANYHVE